MNDRIFYSKCDVAFNNIRKSLYQFDEEINKQHSYLPETMDFIRKEIDVFTSALMDIGLLMTDITLKKSSVLDEKTVELFNGFFCDYLDYEVALEGLEKAYNTLKKRVPFVMETVRAFAEYDNNFNISRKSITYSFIYEVACFVAAYCEYKEADAILYEEFFVYNSVYACKYINKRFSNVYKLEEISEVINLTPEKQKLLEQISDNCGMIEPKKHSGTESFYELFKYFLMRDV